MERLQEAMKLAALMKGQDTYHIDLSVRSDAPSALAF
jgi:hypothetical protein